MTNNIIANIQKVIENNEDYALLDYLELKEEFKDEKEFQDHLSVLLILIEKSPAFESAGTLLWKNIYQDHIFKRDRTDEQYRKMIFSFMKEQAIDPYVRLTSLISRLITTIIYDTTKSQTGHITKLTPLQYLIEINEYFLEKFVSQHDMEERTIGLLYNCIVDINLDTRRIHLSEKACQIVRRQIVNGGLYNYLSFFIRPFYSSMSSYWLPDALYHVPEPFYQQIFETDEAFRQILSSQIESGTKKEIVREISAFMNQYWINKSQGKEFVYVSPLKLHKKLHTYLREVE